MKNKDIDKYNLSDEAKAKLRRMRNKRRKLKRSMKRGSRSELRRVQKVITLLQKDGER